MENKRKHLEIIQSVITRMANNSFMLKGWAVTLVVALFALDLSITSINILKIAFLPTILFWLLDGYFLCKERLFRDLYDVVRKNDDSQIDFSMKTESNVLQYLDALFSKTLTLFYGATIIVLAYYLCLSIS